MGFLPVAFLVVFDPLAGGLFRIAPALVLIVCRFAEVSPLTAGLEPKRITRLGATTLASHF